MRRAPMNMASERITPTTDCVSLSSTGEPSPLRTLHAPRRSIIPGKMCAQKAVSTPSCSSEKRTMPSRRMSARRKSVRDESRTVGRSTAVGISTAAARAPSDGESPSSINASILSTASATRRLAQQAPWLACFVLRAAAARRGGAAQPSGDDGSHEQHN
eukprot:6211514-Pleurochrysis_carterae.AAC.2